MVGNYFCIIMPIYGLTPTSLPTWRISNEMHGNAIGPIRSRGTKLSILIGSLVEGPGILLYLVIIDKIVLVVH